MTLLDIEKEFASDIDLKYFVRQGKKKLIECFKETNNDECKTIETIVGGKIAYSNVVLDYIGSEFHFDSQIGEAPILKVRYNLLFKRKYNNIFEYVIVFDYTGILISSSIESVEAINEKT